MEYSGCYGSTLFGLVCWWYNMPVLLQCSCWIYPHVVKLLDLSTCSEVVNQLTVLVMSSVQLGILFAILTFSTIMIIIKLQYYQYYYHHDNYQITSSPSTATIWNFSDVTAECYKLTCLHPNSTMCTNELVPQTKSHTFYIVMWGIIFNINFSCTLRDNIVMTVTTHASLIFIHMKL